MNYGVVLLAAGASLRMGRPKLLLPWGSSSVLGHLLEQWGSLAPAAVGVVCDPNQPALQAELDRLGWPAERRIPNPDPARGMFSSIQCAATWKGWPAAITHWAITLGDQPLIQTESLRHLLQFASARSHQVCQPSRHGRGRHPVILPARVFALLPGAATDSLKEFLAATGQPAARCEIDDPGLDLDLDVPADYDRALAHRAVV